MITEDENWEDSIRHTFIELGNYMHQHSNPIEFLIDFAWANGADRFVVNNAKDELKRLRESEAKFTLAKPNDTQNQIIALYRTDHG